MAVSWRDMSSKLEKEMLERKRDTVSILQDQLTLLEVYLRDYQQQIERAEHQIENIQVEASRIRKEIGEHEVKT